MAEDIRMLFLKESLRDCEEVFADAAAREQARAWDYLVVTAANEAQAAAYRVQIERRQRDGRAFLRCYPRLRPTAVCPGRRAAWSSPIRAASAWAAAARR